MLIMIVCICSFAGRCVQFPVIRGRSPDREYVP